MHALISDPDFNFRNRISLFCSAIPFLGIPLFFFLRSGLEEKYSQELIISAGICLFLLFGPTLISARLKSNRFFLKSESLLLWIFLMALAALQVIPYSIYLIILIGLFSFVICLYCFLMSQKLSWKIFLMVILACLFSIWVLFTTWAVHRPTLFETLAFNRNVFQVQDLFFHAAISGIIKSYGTPSTGLQGTPYAYYHFGSHWYFAQISKLTDIHVLRLYLVFYPFVIVPCFFKVFLTFANDVRRALNAKSTFSMLSAAFLFCVFLGIPNHLYSRGFFDASILGFESLLVSFLLMFVLGSIWIELYLGKKTLADFSTAEKIFMLVVSPLIFWSIGLTKISTLFVMLGPFSFLVLRFNRWTDVVGVSFYITLIGSCFVYYYIAETIPFGIRNHGHEGDLKLGSVYTAMSENKLYNPVHWFVMFFSWTYLVIAIITIFKIKRLWLADVDQKALSVMMWVSIMAAVAGLLPTFFFSFNGANAMFFVAVQMFISGGFLMALGPTIQSAIARNKILIVSFFAACLVLLVIIHKKIRFTAKEILIENLNTRILISDRNAAPKVRFSLNHDLKVIANGFSDLQKKADSNTLYQVLKNAEKLGNREDRRTIRDIAFYRRLRKRKANTRHRTS